MPYNRVKSLNLGPNYTGLATVGYTLVGDSRTTSGVAESPSGSGIYKATVAFPDNYVGDILWDTGAGTTPTIYASDDDTAPPPSAGGTDPLSSAVPGAYPAGSAGAVLGAVASGVPVSGYAAGQDPATIVMAHPVETGLTLGGVFSLMAAALFGDISGQETNAPAIKAAGNPGTTRITASTDADGNRTVTLHLS